MPEQESTTGSPLSSHSNLSKCQGITFHHFGLGVRDFAPAVNFYRNLGYECPDPIVDPLQEVELILCTRPGHPSVEMVKPSSESSPVFSYLKRANEMIYHTCYELDDFSQDATLLFKDSRAICVSSPKPAVLFNNRLVSFYYVKDVGLIEILEKKNQ